jgi:hypothetical protein
MSKLFNWLISAVAIAATAYVLNTYSISRTNNEVNLKGPKSDTTITYNSGRGEIKNTYNNGKDNIETTLGKDANGFFGSIRDSSKSVSGNFNHKSNKGTFSGNIGDFLSQVELDYDPARTNTFDRWVSGFEYLYDNNGQLSGYKGFRI